MAITSGNLSVHEVTSPKELHDIWPRIREGLNAIRNKCPLVVEMPEDAYYDLKTGKTKLLVATIDECYEGFMILTETHEVDGLGLLVTHVHNAGEDKLFIANLLTTVKDFVTLMHYTRVTFAITRKGWTAALGRLSLGPSYQTILHTIEAYQ
jgi:hypothetical protein